MSNQELRRKQIALETSNLAAWEHLRIQLLSQAKSCCLEAGISFDERDYRFTETQSGRSVQLLITRFSTFKALQESGTKRGLKLVAKKVEKGEADPS